TQALELVDMGQRAQVFHAARSILVNRKEELRLFEIIFNIFWRTPGQQHRSRGQPAPIAPRHNVAQQRPSIVALMAQKAQAGDPEVDVADKSGTFSAAEVLQRKQFSEMTPEELETIKKIIQSMRWRISVRKTRRYAPDSSGARLNLRRVMRSCVKHGGVPLRLSWKRRTEKARPVIVLADISGSMERYTRLLLQFYYSLTRGLSDVECFLFGTRLTRITPQLRIRNVDQAISQAAKQVVDWAGGTRIGDSLYTFNREWSRRVLRRGAIVLIISDGWERGDTGLLRQQMRYLQLRCHHLIWLNPLLGHAQYQPQVEGMAAALPFVDDFLPIHNLQSLEMLAEHLATLDDR
ncbi:MAG: VWA domain-containing protein, partial [Anaerolineae bacterium]|nr:VWA domain-containing protein [Anaerolineae bacterium]